MLRWRRVVRSSFSAGLAGLAMVACLDGELNELGLVEGEAGTGVTGGMGGSGSLLGGSSPAGGASVVAGAQPLGGSSPAGGATLLGGASPAGGAQVVGGSSPAGGAIVVAGAAPVGGAVVQGGSGPIGGAGTGGGRGIGCDCFRGPNVPACGVDGVTYSVTCAGECSPVDIACAGECPCAGGEEQSPICSEPIDPGPCDAAFERWAWDAEAGRCVPFVFGGCEGNANRFWTLGDCQAACAGGRDERTIGLVDQCESSGGQVRLGSCCATQDDFPAECAPGPCGCAPADSVPTLVCECPVDQCFDGSSCISAFFE